MYWCVYVYPESVTGSGKYYYCGYNIFLSDIEGWGISPRGAGYLFGSDVVQQVCSLSLLSLSFIVAIMLHTYFIFYSLGQ